MRRGKGKATKRMVIFRISLNSTEADALAKLAYSELRDPRDQLRWILSRELERVGLLSSPIAVSPSLEVKSMNALGLLQVLKIPTSINKYHESLLRSYHILLLVEQLLKENTPPQVVLAILQELRQAPGLEEATDGL